ncbi:hypothetical protein AGMMS4956_13310 [Bacteroidia bacterium]|nr:hypothetical protein AGMMS4956_13310 [Bacteroidia bacterium]
MNNHTNFIKSSITDILKDVVSASAGIGNGIETYPLCDYIMQSAFLKMTGFQEQKMKCICWEMATNDYEYRYKRFSQKPLGECSCYDEKKAIYKDLVEHIEKHIPNFNVSVHIDKQSILANTILEITTTFSNTNLSIWAQNDFNEFTNNCDIIKEEQFITRINNQSNETKLFENELKDKYDLLYNHRNRSAHNTQSYQQNLPTLKTLADENYKYENYFLRFAILILIDKIFIELYRKYLDVLEDGL